MTIRETSDTKVVLMRKSLDDSQKAYKRTNGKHRYVKPTRLGEGMTYEEHEYVGPLGVGYMGIQKVTRRGIEFVKIEDFGPNGYDMPWTEVEREVL